VSTPGSWTSCFVLSRNNLDVMKITPKQILRYGPRWHEKACTMKWRTVIAIRQEVLPILPSSPLFLQFLFHTGVVRFVDETCVGCKHKLRFTVQRFSRDSYVWSSRKVTIRTARSKGLLKWLSCSSCQIFWICFVHTKGRTGWTDLIRTTRGCERAKRFGPSPHRIYN
jgi:hypothetical protein